MSFLKVVKLFLVFSLQNYFDRFMFGFWTKASYVYGNGKCSSSSSCCDDDDDDAVSAFVVVVVVVGLTDASALQMASCCDCVNVMVGKQFLSEINNQMIPS